MGSHGDMGRIPHDGVDRTEPTEPTERPHVWRLDGPDGVANDQPEGPARDAGSGDERPDSAANDQAKTPEEPNGGQQFLEALNRDLSDRDQAKLVGVNGTFLKRYQEIETAAQEGRLDPEQARLEHASNRDVMFTLRAQMLNPNMMFGSPD
ncbi:MAG: hypothetical protein J2P36_36415 [Ktedonobacteraceae bacterium]|nr:hypothetical protein [Ktedonobacteraceae bacterium]